MRVSIPASEWNEVSELDRPAFLQSKGIPVNDAGVWTERFDGVELGQVGGVLCWTYYWAGDEEA